MPIWILIAGTLIPQEFATTAVVFVYALQKGVSIWEINLIWFLITCADMTIGYRLGVLTKRKLAHARLFDWIDRASNKTKSSLGLHGEKFTLALLGIIDFPYLNTFLGAWIGLPFKTSFLLTLAGNFVWYMLLWATVLGLSAFTSNSSILLLLLVGVGLLSHFLFKLSRANKG